jgi:PAS domain S-box-containing protein
VLLRTRIGAQPIGDAVLRIGRNQITGYWHRAAQLLLGGAVLAALTWICFELRADLATASFVYLVAIILLSLKESFTSSATLSILAIACLAYFFAPPIFDLRIHDARDLVIVTAFLLTSFIVTTLVRRAREQTEAAFQAEVKAKEAEKGLRLAVDTIPALIWTASADGSLDFINQRWDDLGLSLDDLRASEWMALIHPAERDRVVDKWRTAVETGAPYENIERVRRADGEYRWFLSRARPLRDGSGKIIKWYGADADIEDQRRAQDALRRSEANLIDAQRLSRTGNFAWTVSSGEIFWSAETFRIFQYDRTTTPTVGHVVQRIHPEDADLVKQKIECALQDKKNLDYEHRLVMPDGSIKHVHIVAHALTGESGSIEFIGAVMDVTAAKEAQDALRESEQRFRDYAETASDWLWETGPDHRFTRISEHVDKTGMAPPNREGLVRWQYATDVESEPDKWRLHHAMLDAHQPFRGFVFGTTRADGSPMYIQSSGKPFFDAKGDFLGYRGVSADVTAEVRAAQIEEALRKVQAELAHVTRITTLGELTASIAHEVNQPLTAVVTNAEAGLHWLDRGTPDLDEARHALEGIIKDGKRAGEVIRHVRALSNKSDTQKAPLNINDVVKEVIALIQPELSSRQVALGMDLAPALPLVLADRVQLQQVLINLVMNGIEAMESVTDRPRQLLVRSQQNDAHQVVVTVQDCGVGISVEIVDRLFNAFFTTKSSGMGMGLSICRSIIEAHAGRLSASGNDGPGATFRFALPALMETTS